MAKMKKPATTEEVVTKTVKTPKVKMEKTPQKRGRKVNGESERQKRLAKYEAKRANGVEVKRGRPTGSKQKVK